MQPWPTPACKKHNEHTYMKQIKLIHALPAVFAGLDKQPSDIWLQDFRFERGQFYLVEAESGTGKSSLCSYLYGYRHDYEGKICFDDADIRTLSARQWVNIRRESLSLLFQELRLFPELTALENIQLKNSITHSKSPKDIELLLEQLQIADKTHVPVSKLSYGQQQRVAFIRSLCQPFDFLLLDEPISHLDETNAHIMADILTSEARQRNAGVIITSVGKPLPLDYKQILKL